MGNPTLMNVPIDDSRLAGLVANYCDAARDFAEHLSQALRQGDVATLIVSDVANSGEVESSPLDEEELSSGTVSEFVFEKSERFWDVDKAVRYHSAVLWPPDEDQFLDFVDLAWHHFDQAGWMMEIVRKATCVYNDLPDVTLEEASFKGPPCGNWLDNICHHESKVREQLCQLILGEVSYAEISSKDDVMREAINDIAECRHVIQKSLPSSELGLGISPSLRQSLEHAQKLTQITDKLKRSKERLSEKHLHDIRELRILGTRSALNYPEDVPGGHTLREIAAWMGVDYGIVKRARANLMKDSDFKNIEFRKGAKRYYNFRQAKKIIDSARKHSRKACGA